MNIKKSSLEFRLFLKAVLWAVMLMASIIGAQETAPQSQSVMSVRPVSSNEISLQALIKQIRVADPDDIFGVEMVFESPVQIGLVRDVARLLQIPRVMAFVEYQQTPGHQRKMIATIELGTLFDKPDIWQHGVCRGWMRVFFPENRQHNTRL